MSNRRRRTPQQVHLDDQLVAAADHAGSLFDGVSDVIRKQGRTGIQAAPASTPQPIQEWLDSLVPQSAQCIHIGDTPTPVIGIMSLPGFLWCISCAEEIVTALPRTVCDMCKQGRPGVQYGEFLHQHGPCLILGWSCRTCAEAIQAGAA